MFKDKVDKFLHMPFTQKKNLSYLSFEVLS